MKKARVLLKDIAREANCSLASVSRALSTDVQQQKLVAPDTFVSSTVCAVNSYRFLAGNLRQLEDFQFEVFPARAGKPELRCASRYLAGVIPYLHLNLR